jgi:E3 ubiquitin-protein ligase SHPRH
MLHQQRDLLLEWRDKITGMLTRKLSEAQGEGGDADGQEYARALDTQGEVEQYLQAYSGPIIPRAASESSHRSVQPPSLQTERNY